MIFSSAAFSTAALSVRLALQRAGLLHDFTHQAGWTPVSPQKERPIVVSRADTVLPENLLFLIEK
jgi:hypothetical protein